MTNAEKDSIIDKLNKARPVGQAVKTSASHAENMGSIPVRVTKKRDRHHKRVSVSFFVLRTKPNPLVRVEMCRFAEILFAQGVRIPRVQSTTRYCGSTEIYQEIITDLEIISSLSTRAPHSRTCLALGALLVLFTLAVLIARIISSPANIPRSRYAPKSNIPMHHFCGDFSFLPASDKTQIITE